MLGLVGVIALAGCGGGTRQDANEPEGTFPVEVVDASFPRDQRTADEAVLRVDVRNAGDQAIPDIALTLGKASGKGGVPAFAESVPGTDSGVQLASPSRPVWVLEQGPLNGDTAYVNTWSLGRLAPKKSRTFTFRLTPVRAGSYELTYRLAAGLNGKAKATLPGGAPATGSFSVRVSGAPAPSAAG